MITIYTKANCPKCVKVKTALSLKSVPYQEVRIDLDNVAREMLIQDGHKSVPVLYKEGKPITLDEI